MAYGVNAPFGLKPSRLLSGATWNDQTTKYTLDTATARSIFTNDPVILVDTGRVTCANYAGGSVINQALLGSFQGCQYYATNGQLVSSPVWITGTQILSGTTVTCFITDDPSIIYDIQCSISGADVDATAVQLGLYATNVFNNAGFAAAGTFAVNPPKNNPAIPAGPGYNGGQSVVYLDLANINNTATTALKIIGLTPQVQNVFRTAAAVGVGAGNFNNALVIINNHVYKGGTGTAGV